jgi:glutamate formiminotransferase
MGKSILTAEEKKAASDKAYRERKKLGIVARPTETDEAPVKAAKVVKVVKSKEVKAKKEATTEKEVSESFTKTFGFPVRLFWNQRIEDENSSCAKPGTELTFEEMGKKNEETLYRVRRGKRNFFTTSKELVEPANEPAN